jgi:hypothetical protein
MLVGKQPAIPSAMETTTERTLYLALVTLTVVALVAYFGSLAALVLS